MRAGKSYKPFVTRGDEDGPVLRARVRLRYIIVILCMFGTVAAAVIDNKSRTEAFGNLEPYFYLTWPHSKTEVGPQFVKSNSHLLLTPCSPFTDTFFLVTKNFPCPS